MMKDINVSVETLYDSDKKISQFVDYINSLHSKIGDIKKIGTAFSNEPNALNLINDCVSRFANILEQAENLDIKFKTLIYIILICHYLKMARLLLVHLIIF